MDSERASQRAFFGVSALLFAAGAALTIAWCASMSTIGEMRLGPPTALVGVGYFFVAGGRARMKQLNAPEFKVPPCGELR